MAATETIRETIPQTNREACKSSAMKFTAGVIKNRSGEGGGRVNCESAINGGGKRPEICVVADSRTKMASAPSIYGAESVGRRSIRQFPMRISRNHGESPGTLIEREPGKRITMQRLGKGETVFFPTGSHRLVESAKLALIATIFLGRAIYRKPFFFWRAPFPRR